MHLNTSDPKDHVVYTVSNQRMPACFFLFILTAEDSYVPHFKQYIYYLLLRISFLHS